MQEKKVEVRGGMFSTEVLEAGSGAPLLYLHGVRNPSAGDPLLARLADRYHVIAPRHSGFGESSGSDNLLDIFDLIYYYLDFLDTMGLSGIPVVGQSLGGMFAAELAAVQPDRFSKLVLIDSLGLWNPEFPVADFFSMTPRELSQASYHDTRSSAAQSAGEAPEQEESYIAFMVDRAKALATTAKYTWPVPNRGLKKRLHRVKAPTLLVWGESDHIVPVRYAQEFQALIPGAKIELIPEAGYYPQDEQPDRLAQVVLDFLAG